MPAEDYDALLDLQMGLIRYVEQYRLVTGGNKQKPSSSAFAKISLKSITTTVDDPMEIGSIDLSNADQVRERLKYLCSRGADGKFPSVQGRTKENQADRRLLEKHQIYFGCRRAYSGGWDSAKYQKHKEDCGKGCNPRQNKALVAVVDISSLNIEEADDGYFSSSTNSVVNPTAEEVKNKNICVEQSSSPSISLTPISA